MGEKKKIEVVGGPAIEPALIIHMTATTMFFMIVQDILLFKTCSVDVNLPQDTCRALSKSNEGLELEEKEIQSVMGNIIFYRELIVNSFPIILVLMLGGWSDVWGRKIPIIMPMIGYAISIISLLFVVKNELLGGWAVAFTFIPISLTGNQPTFSMGAFSYVSDTTIPSKRTARVGITHSSFFFGLTAGLALAGYLSTTSLTFIQMLRIVLFLEVIAISYVYCLIPNMAKEEETKGKSAIGALFNLNNLKEVLKTGSKKRKGGKTLLPLLLTHTSLFVPMMGEFAVCYLFGRIRFGWDAGEFGTFMTFKMVIGFIGTFVSIGLLGSVFKLSDSGMGIVSAISAGSTCITFAFVKEPSNMYLACLLSLLSGAALIVPRSMMGKLAGEAETGRVNSLVGVVEAIVPLIAGPLYMAVYSKTMDVLPGAFFLMSAAFLIYPLLTYISFVRETPEKLAGKKL